MILSRNFQAVLASVMIVVGSVATRPANANENDVGIWSIFSTTDSFADDATAGRWHYWFDAQARYLDPGSGINQWLVRPAIGYEIGEGAKAWAGYARIRSRNRAGRVTDENRYWQQIDWRAGEWQGGRVTMRARLEQRSVETGNDLGVVLRFMTKYVRPFSNNDKASLVVSLEPFVDLKDTDWGGDSGIGQHRAFVGTARRVSNKLTVEAGYMNQYIFVDTAQDRINHLAVLNFKAKL